MIAQDAAIVVEGGAMRGVYAAGVLDVFHERGFHPFALAIGASAGACNLASHLAGQHRRNFRCYTTQMRRSAFLDARRYLRGGHWLDLDYLWDAFDAEDPLDIPGVAGSPTRLVVAATDVDTGEPAYLEPVGDDLREILRATSAVPMLYRRTVELAGHRYADGGVSAPIPVEEAYRRGARRIVVIRSRPYAFAGPARLETALAQVLLRRQPGLARAFRAYRRIYASSVAFLRSPPADCRVVEVVPARALRSGRTTRDLASLADDYALGREAGVRAIAAW